MLHTVRLEINPSVFIKNPESTELGRKILTEGINLIDKIGYDDFTFRKLGQKIGSPEASVYRYFQSKQKFLLYLTSWYWAWMDYRLEFAIANIQAPEQKLERTISLLTERVTEDSNFTFMNIIKLSRIVFTESSKSYLNKDVDEQNKQGVYLGYKQLVAKASKIISEVSPKYKYPNMLITTVIEGAHLQHFFADHLPKLTNKTSENDYVKKFYLNMVIKTIAPDKK
ncbi:MAG: TetR/AcrR family transcriptional regulator [Bacteroidia bacterium]